MATTSEARALPFFTDIYGSPLESGFIYIGQPGLDPLSYPVRVTSDGSGLVTVEQPIRTVHGHATNAGALIHLFCPIPYSITVLDSAGRVVYASLTETDPIITAIGTSSVQTANSLAELRARDKNSTNQVWVQSYGMYVYSVTDTTSPENIPFTIVGSDGGRYHLSQQYVSAHWMYVSDASPPANIQGLWVSYGDAPGQGQTFLSNNQGAGVGGFVLRNVNSGATVELGRVTISGTGGISATDTVSGANGVVATSGDVRASSGNVFAVSGTLSLNADASRALNWDGSYYNFLGAPLKINGSQAMNIANQQSNGVGALALGTNTGPSPSLPGTWVSTGTASNSVYLWLRTA